jgi:hypothetical protein
VVSMLIGSLLGLRSLQAFPYECKYNQMS